MTHPILGKISKDSGFVSFPRILGIALIPAVRGDHVLTGNMYPSATSFETCIEIAHPSEPSQKLQFQ